MDVNKDYDERLNPFADVRPPPQLFRRTSPQAAHANSSSHVEPSVRTDINAIPLRRAYAASESSEYDFKDRVMPEAVALNDAAMHANSTFGKERKSPFSGGGGAAVAKSDQQHSTSLSHERVARFLLDKQLLLSALEFYTELLDQKIVITSLRDFFSNPGNFELPVINNVPAFTSQQPQDNKLNTRTASGGSDMIEQQNILRASSMSTLSDSVSLADVDLIGTANSNAVALQEMGGPSQHAGGSSSSRIALLEYELRKARETIQHLRDSLTNAAAANTASASSTHRSNSISTVIMSQAIAPTPLSTGMDFLPHQPLQRHELRALNFLVSEYLVEHNYKLTSITFSDENAEQDFDDWDDVGLNTPKPDSLTSIFEQHICGTRMPNNSIDSAACGDGSFFRQNSSRTIIPPNNSKNQPVVRKDSTSQTDTVIVTEDKNPTELHAAEMPLQRISVGIQVDIEPDACATNQVANLFAADVAEKQKAVVASGAMMAVRNEIYNPDAFQTTFLRYLLTTSSLLLINPSLSNNTTNIVDADELRIHSAIDSIFSTVSSKENEIGHNNNNNNNNISVACLKHIVPGMILAKRQEIIPVLTEAYLSTADDEERENILKQLFNIVNKPDDTQRRLVLKALTKICYYSSAERLETQLLPLCWSQASHKYPERRQLVAETCAVLSQYVTADMNSSLILSTLKQMWSEEQQRTLSSVRRSVALSLAACCARFYDNNSEDVDEAKFSFAHALFWQCVQKPRTAAAITENVAVMVEDVGFHCILSLCAYLALKRRTLLRYTEHAFLNRLRHLARRRMVVSSGRPLSPTVSTERAPSRKNDADDDDENISDIEADERINLILRALNILCTPICAQLIASAPVVAVDDTSNISSQVYRRRVDDKSLPLLNMPLFLKFCKPENNNNINDLNNLMNRFHAALSAVKTDTTINSSWNDMLWMSDVFLQQLAKSACQISSQNTVFIDAMCNIVDRLCLILDNDEKKQFARQIILPTFAQHFEQAVCSRIFSRAAIFPVYICLCIIYADDENKNENDALTQLNALILSAGSPAPPLSTTSTTHANDEKINLNAADNNNVMCASGFIYIFRKIFFSSAVGDNIKRTAMSTEAIRLIQEFARQPASSSSCNNNNNVQLLVAKILSALLEEILLEVNYAATTNTSSALLRDKKLLSNLCAALFELFATDVNPTATLETRRHFVMPLVLLLRKANTDDNKDNNNKARVVELLAALFDEPKTSSSSTEDVADVAAECLRAMNAVDGFITSLDSDTFQQFLLPRLSYLVARADTTTTTASAATIKPHINRRRRELCAALLQAYVSVTCCIQFQHSPPIKTSVRQSLLRLQRELQQQQSQFATGSTDAQQQQEYLHLCQSLLDKCHVVLPQTPNTASFTGVTDGSSSSGVLNRLKGLQPFSSSSPSPSSRAKH